MTNQKAFTTIEVILIGVIVVFGLVGINVIRNSWGPKSPTPLPTSGQAIPAPTLTLSEPTPTPFDVTQLTGTYINVPQVCLGQPTSNACKTEFKKLVDDKCGGRLRNEGCEEILDETLGYSAERACLLDSESGVCKCLQTKDLRSDICRDAFFEIVMTGIRQKCVEEPERPVCACQDTTDLKACLTDVIKKSLRR